MSDSNELLALRLVLIGVIFVFVLLAAIVLRSSLRARRAEVRPEAAARGMSPRLVVLSPANSGLRAGSEFELAGTMTIGRDDGNGISLGDSSISGRHAVIEPSARGWRVRDLGSTNGTFVNGRAVDGRGALLRPGEHLALGAVTFRFVG